MLEDLALVMDWWTIVLYGCPYGLQVAIKEERVEVTVRGFGLALLPQTVLREPISTEKK